jgi:hypothetical protein
MNSLVGTYVCSAHIGKSTENGYHHVKVIVHDDGHDSFCWINQAGVSWSLTVDSKNHLQVHNDCPYFKTGYTRCRVEMDSNGKISALIGPFHERYDKVKQTSCHEQRPPLMLPFWTVYEDDATTFKRQRCRHVMILPVSSTGATWGDLAFLAAIPASTVLNAQGQRPTVLVVDDVSSKDDDALEDFFIRYKPTNVMMFHSDQIQINVANECPTGNVGIAPKIHHETWDSLESVTVALAKAAWPTSPSSDDEFRVVLVRKDDYAAALLASSLASRIGAPLFFVGDDSQLDDSVLCAMRDLRPCEIISLGENINDEVMNVVAGLIQCATTISIPTVTHAISWLNSQGLPIDYLALVNPADRTAKDTCKSRKLSLTAPIYAARRNGLVITVSEYQ